MNRKLLLVCLLFVAPAAFATWTILGNLFEAPRIYATGANPLDVVTADLNGDGDLDVLTANRDGLTMPSAPALADSSTSAAASSDARL